MLSQVRRIALLLGWLVVIGWGALCVRSGALFSSSQRREAGDEVEEGRVAIPVQDGALHA